MTIVLDNPIALIIGIVPLAAFSFFIVRAQKVRADNERAKAGDLALATSQKETEIYRESCDRLQKSNAEKDTAIADFKAKTATQDKQIADLTALIRQDAVSPALVTILEKIAGANLAQYQAGMNDLKHYAEAQFLDMQKKLDSILQVASTWSDTTERRSTH